MSYRIEFTPAAEKSLEGLSKKNQRLVLRRIEALADDPRPATVETLKGTEGFFRIRAGNYRIVYQIKRSKLLVTIITINDRKEVYRRLKRRR